MVFWLLVAFWVTGSDRYMTLGQSIFTSRSFPNGKIIGQFCSLALLQEWIEYSSHHLNIQAICIYHTQQQI